MHRFDSAMRHVSFFYKISALSVISGLTVLIVTLVVKLNTATNEFVNLMAKRYT